MLQPLRIYVKIIKVLYQKLESENIRLLIRMIHKSTENFLKIYLKPLTFQTIFLATIIFKFSFKG